MSTLNFFPDAGSGAQAPKPASGFDYLGFGFIFFRGEEDVKKEKQERKRCWMKLRQSTTYLK